MSPLPLASPSEYMRRKREDGLVDFLTYITTQHLSQNVVSLDTFFEQYKERFFELRMKAIVWLMEAVERGEHINLYDLGEGINLTPTTLYAQREAIRVLQENVDFALRVHTRFLMRADVENIDNHTAKVSASTQYQPFIASLEMVAPQVANNVKALLDASLRLEAGFICVMLIHDHPIAEGKDWELCKFVAQSAQDFASLAVRMGLTPRRTPKKHTEKGLNQIAQEEDFAIANQGIDIFKQAIDNA